MEFCSFKLGAGLGVGCRMLRRLGALISAVLVCCGCPVHQWPDPYLPGPDPDGDRRVAVFLRYAPDFRYWEHLYDPRLGAVEELDSGSDAVYSNLAVTGVMDIWLKVYGAGDMEQCLGEYSCSRDVAEGYDCEVELELPAGEYDLVVWSHLREDGEAEPFYEMQDLRGIRIIDGNYRGSTDYRDAFRGRESIRVPAAGDDAFCEVAMRRPMGKFEFVTTDLAEFLERETQNLGRTVRANAEDYRVVISYPYYYPNSYNVIADDHGSDSGYRFETRMTVTGEDEASMGFDYVFIRDIEDGAVQAQVSVYDLDGRLAANSQVITIPIRRDRHTVLRGAFLLLGASGGVGVDPDYDGDHNVLIP